MILGEVGTLVQVENDNNTDVASWQIDLVYTPPGSSVLIAVPLAFNNSSSTPLATFTPDIEGPWRLVLKVWEVINRVGIPAEVDIRVFGIRELKHGFVIAPYQKDPDPLPTLASGEPGAKPNEMNLGGQEFGWDGRDEDLFLAGVLNQLNASTFDLLPQPQPHQEDTTPVIQRVSETAFVQPICVVLDGQRMLVVSSNFSRQFNENAPKITRVSSIKTVIDETPAPTGVVRILDFVAANSQFWAVGEGTGGSGIIFNVVSGGSVTFGAVFTLDANNPLTSIDFDGTHLWVMCAGAGTLYKIHPVTPGVPVASLLVVADVVRADPNGANYGDSNPRVYTVNFSGLVVANRITTVGFPLIDGTVSLSGTSGGGRLGVGDGFIWLSGEFTDSPGSHQLVKCNPNPFATSSTGNYIRQIPNGINSISLSGSTLVLLGEDFYHNVVFVTVNTTTLTLMASTTLGTDGENTGYGSAPPTRMAFLGSYGWIPDFRPNGSLLKDPGGLLRAHLFGVERAERVPVQEITVTYEPSFSDKGQFNLYEVTEVFPQAGQSPTVRDHQFNSPFSVRTDGVHAWVVNSGLVTTRPSVTRFTLEPTPRPVDSIPLWDGGANEVIYDIIYDGTYFWALWQFQGGGFLRQIVSGSSPFVGVDFITVSALSPIFDGLYDGTYLWAISSTELHQVNLNTLGGPAVTSFLVGNNLTRITRDPVGANYPDTQPRLWISEANSGAGTGRVYRFHPVSLTVDALVFFGGGNDSAYDVAVGGSFIWAVGIDSVGVPTIWKITPNPAAVNSFGSLAAAFGATGVATSLVYDSTTSKVFVSGNNSAGTLFIARVNTSTLAVESFATVPGYEDSFPTGRLTQFGPGPRSLWMPAARTSATDRTGGISKVSNDAFLEVAPVTSVPREVIWEYPLGAPVKPKAVPDFSGLMPRYNGEEYEIRSFLGDQQFTSVASQEDWDTISDYILCSPPVGGVTINLVEVVTEVPAQDDPDYNVPKVVTITDRSGLSATRNITIRPTTDGSIVSPTATYTFGSPLVLNNNFESVTLVQTIGSPNQWNIIARRTLPLGFSGVVTTTSPYTVTAEDGVGVNRTAASVVVLPTLTASKTITVYDWAGNADSFPITISPPGGQNINGLLDYVVNTPFGSVELLWTNTTSRWIATNEYKNAAIITTAALTTNLGTQNSIVLVDSLVGARTVNLPAFPRTNETHTIKDRDDNASVNNVTIGRNGNFIDGVASDYLLATNGGSVTLQWTNSVSASFGWRIV
jgi:hypothetical protein